MTDRYWIIALVVVCLSSYICGAMCMRQHLTGRWLPEESVRDWWRRMSMENDNDNS